MKIKSMRIIVVDDSKMIRQLVAECVKSMGHEVVFAEDGIECLQFLKDNRVDLILMDIEMPGLNGLEATKKIRELKQDDWFPIIFLTTRVDDNAFTDGILAGGDAYLSKPLNPLRLQLTVIAMERIYQMRQKLFLAQQELMIVNQELEKLSLTDQLTGLANRRNFDQTLAKEYKIANRKKSPLALIVCDIDYFKLYNDCYGHQQGDECLVTVSGTIVAEIKRPADLCCRYGGEEFAIILPDTDLQGARALAEKICISVRGKSIPHEQSKIANCVTLSLGVTTYFGQFKTGRELFKAADEALYHAKTNGRDRVEINVSA